MNPWFSVDLTFISLRTREFRAFEESGSSSSSDRKDEITGRDVLFFWNLGSGFRVFKKWIEGSGSSCSSNWKDEISVPRKKSMGFLESVYGKKSRVFLDSLVSGF
jgi:hypothetical protein